MSNRSPFRASNTAKAALVFASAAALTLGAAPLAGAQGADSLLPGASASGTIVVTDSPRVSIKVGENTGGENIEVTITNNYDHKFRCFAPGVSSDAQKPSELPNTVTEASIVAKTVNYYRSWPSSPSDGVNFPLIGVIPTDGFLEFIPKGLLGTAFGKQLTTRAALFKDWDHAKIAGHNGEIPVFDLEAHTSTSKTVTLGKPGSGERADFDAAALVYCTDTEDAYKQSYVFAGYETGKAPVVRPDGSVFDPPLGSPSLGSPSLPTGKF